MKTGFIFILLPLLTTIRISFHLQNQNQISRSQKKKVSFTTCVLNIQILLLDSSKWHTPAELNGQQRSWCVSNSVQGSCQVVATQKSHSFHDSSSKQFEECATTIYIATFVIHIVLCLGLVYCGYQKWQSIPQLSSEQYSTHVSEIVYWWHCNTKTLLQIGRAHV